MTLLPVHTKCLSGMCMDSSIYVGLPISGHTAIISLVQNLRPRVFPLLHLQVPATTTLLFKDTPEGPMIYSHQDSWSLEGIVQSMPLLGWWYDHIARYVSIQLITMLLPCTDGVFTNGTLMLTNAVVLSR